MIKQIMKFLDTNDCDSIKYSVIQGGMVEVEIVRGDYKETYQITRELIDKGAGNRAEEFYNNELVKRLNKKDKIKLIPIGVRYEASNI